MGVKSALVDRLLTSSTLVSLVKRRVKLGWMKPSKAVYPYVTVHQISHRGSHHFATADPLAFPTFQIDVWATRASQRETIAEAIRNVIDGWKGTQSGIDIRRIRLTGKGADSEEGPTDASGSPIFRTRMEAEIVHREAVPTHS